jgi:nicotinamide-nucleotide amidase
MTAILLTVGDEILLGQIVDTNAAWLGEKLALTGIDVRRSETVGDSEEAIKAALGRAYADGTDLVVVTGGLGPTADDRTRPAVAGFFGRRLVLHQDLLDGLLERYAARERTMPEMGRLMAEVPEGFEVVPNPIGTAPGLWGERVVGTHVQRAVLMPGVPYEMKAMARETVLPRIRDLQPGAVLHRTLLTVGRGESDIADLVEPVAARFPEGVGVAYLPSRGKVRVRVTARGAERSPTQAALDAATAGLRDALGDLVFGEDAVLLEGVVQDLLVERGLTLAIAESCTGGALAARITRIAGASRAFVGGVVAYDNDIKQRVLGVPPDLLDAHGAVSEPVARAMAEKVRELLRGDVGLSVTGIAGPTGGTLDKPVGTVWIACAHEGGTASVLLRLTQDRSLNIGLSVSAGLDLLRRTLRTSSGAGDVVR